MDIVLFQKFFNIPVRPDATIHDHMLDPIFPQKFVSAGKNERCDLMFFKDLGAEPPEEERLDF